MESNKKENFDSKKELEQLNIKRLFSMQKMQLEMLQHYLTRNDMYDKNDVFNCLEEIITTNTVINKKIEKLEKNEKRK